MNGTSPNPYYPAGTNIAALEARFGGGDDLWDLIPEWAEQVVYAGCEREIARRFVEILAEEMQCDGNVNTGISMCMSVGERAALEAAIAPLIASWDIEDRAKCLAFIERVERFEQWLAERTRPLDEWDDPRL